MTYVFAAAKVTAEGAGGSGMVWFMLMLAVANLGLGYLAAVALMEPPLWSGWHLRMAKAQLRPAAEHAHSKTAQTATMADHGDRPLSQASEKPELPTLLGLDELPANWLAQLASEGVVAQSFVEAAAHVARLEVGRYREQLVASECRIRACAEDQDPQAIAQLVDELRYINQDWLDKQTAAADVLGQRAGRFGDHEQAATALEQSLLDQAACIRSACGTLVSLDAAQEAENRARQLIELVTTLLNQAHGLRDRILDLLAILIKAGNAIETYGAAVQRDVVTGLPNRIGLELLLDEWCRNDPQRTRLLSAILIDIDRFGRVSQRLGTRAGDRAIVAMARLIDETLPQDRGFERLVRTGGESFMVLQGDTGPHQALSAAERLRQAIEATTFDDEGTEFDMTISCGVIEVTASESSLDVVRRAFETLRFAKKAGRNRCAMDKGEGPAMLDPPQFPVKGRVVSLRAMAMSRATTSNTDSVPVESLA